MVDPRSVRTTGLLRLYARAAALMGPATALLARHRLARGKEDAARVGERRGVTTTPRPEGRLVWLHGASVGEFLSIVPLVEQLQARKASVLVTTVTRTAAALAEKRLPKGAIHQYMPWDVPAFVDRFLDHWRPDLAIFAESELWPNLIIRTTARGAPLIQVNGRMSDRSFANWRRAPKSTMALLSRFELCLTQTVNDARRFEALGAPRVATTGNLKFDVPAPSVDAAAEKALRAALGGRPVFLAASTHDGEEAMALAAHKTAKAVAPGLLTILAPRHPDRAAAIAAAVEGMGFALARRSQGEIPRADHDVYLADTIGEMGLWYRLAPVTFVGGSLVRHGGQNPIEPAKLGSAILHGPHTANFTEVYSALAAGGAVDQVADAQEFGAALRRLLSDPDLRRTRVEAARAAVEGLGGARGRTLGALDPYFLAFAMRRVS